MCKGWQNISANVSRSHFSLHVEKCCSSLCGAQCATLRSLIMGSEVCVVQLTQGLNVVGSCGVLLRIFTSSSNCFLLKMSCHSGNIYSCPYLHLLLFIFASCSKGSSCLAFSSLTNLLFFAFFWKPTLQQFFAISVKKNPEICKTNIFGGQFIELPSSSQS